MTAFDLWLPILLAGVATHIASTIAWTVMPHHKPDWKKLPAEDDLLDLLDAKQVAAEQYLFPYCDDMKEMNTPEFKQKMETRCRGMLILWPAPPNMGKAIGLTLAFFLLAAFLIGYLAVTAFGGPVEDKMDLFAVVFTAGLLVHCLGPFPHAFWFRRKVAMEIVDGVVYALITAGIFTWLWPVG